MQSVPTLGRELLRSPGFASRSPVSVSRDALLDLPEKAIQFGTGAFLRGFVEFFLDQANRHGAFNGRIVLVGSTDSGRDHLLNQQDGLYTLSMQGMQEGVSRLDHEVISCVSRALSASEEWDAVLEVARHPALELVFSNTTEIGIVLDPEDAPDSAPPRSFPGKLTRFLYERARAFDFAATAGVVVIPCELIEANGNRLSDIVHTLATRWRLGEEFLGWLGSAVIFCNTLVDRIVTGAPVGEQAVQLSAALGYRDAMLTICEVYKLFAIEGGAPLRDRLAFANESGVRITSDITPYRERKVRLLNGTHTIMVPVALLCGCETVREALEHEVVGRFVRSTLFGEIVPSVDVPGAEDFAREVLDRFANPFIHHALIDITLQATMKMRVRVVPSIVSYVRRFNAVPQSLAFGFAAYLALVQNRVLEAPSRAVTDTPVDDQAHHVLALWDAASGVDGEDAEEAVNAIITDASLWGTDMTQLSGFASAVTGHLTRIQRCGMLSALEIHLEEAQLCT